MTPEQFSAFFKAEMGNLHEILISKNSDYTAADRDFFANFKTVESFGFCATERGIMTRLLDKVTRIISLLKKKDMAVRDENIFDTLRDLAGYTLILMAYLGEKNKAPRPHGDVFIPGMAPEHEAALCGSPEG